MGFKLHLVVNIKAESWQSNLPELMSVTSLLLIVSLKNCAVCTVNYLEIKAIFTKDLLRSLCSRNLRLFSSIHKGRKNHLLEFEDKLLLRKRSIVESVCNVLKNHMNLEHFRHRSSINSLVCILVCATSTLSKKSNLDFDNLYMLNLSLS